MFVSIQNFWDAMIFRRRKARQKVKIRRILIMVQTEDYPNVTYKQFDFHGKKGATEGKINYILSYLFQLNLEPKPIPPVPTLHHPLQLQAQQ
jgi:hypothetical protein